MSEITLIAAIGRRGQLGLNGDLPWGAAYPADLKRFREITTGGIVVVGRNTWPSIKHLLGTHDRTFVPDMTTKPVEVLIEIARGVYPTRPIYVAGGAKTYRRWMPAVTRFDVTALPYDGPADVFADFLLPHVTRSIP